MRQLDKQSKIFFARIAKHELTKRNRTLLDGL